MTAESNDADTQGSRYRGQDRRRQPPRDYPYGGPERRGRAWDNPSHGNPHNPHNPHPPNGNGNGTKKWMNPAIWIGVVIWVVGGLLYMGALDRRVSGLEQDVERRRIELREEMVRRDVIFERFFTLEREVINIRDYLQSLNERLTREEREPDWPGGREPR